MRPKNPIIIFIFILLFSTNLIAQHTIRGMVVFENKPIERASIQLLDLKRRTLTDTLGYFEFKGLPNGLYKIAINALGYEKLIKLIQVKHIDTIIDIINIIPQVNVMNEVVVSGTMREVSKLASPISIDVYNAKFFKTNPNCSVFDALQNVNGVRPQLNCNICNTGDIHINGLEGPYTMILIDGMPIVSGLSTVYGLSGIPQSLIDRVEIVKGPASTLYGSEAVGGVVNIITKKTSQASKFTIDIFSTSWKELSTDISWKMFSKEKFQSILGISAFNYTNPIDNNKDNFTDVTLQKRLSVFNKWDFNRKNNRLFTIAGRYVIEDRWGGEMNWTKIHQGGETIYGETIATKRWEFLSIYQLPIKEKIFFRKSFNAHNQKSFYGKLPFDANQIIGFGQLNWEKKIAHHELLLGTSLRYVYYDDNTVVTSKVDSNSEIKNLPSITFLPGIFFQDEININPNNILLAGIRYDYNSIHGNIFSPRINYKWNSPNQANIIRIGIGNGYRIANVFTEDHAALTGSREVQFKSNLKPETSWNFQINYQKRISNAIAFDMSLFYTYFSNKIIADYLTNSNKIIYDNIKGYAISKGITTNFDIKLKNFKILLGTTILDVFNVSNNIKNRQLFSEKFTGVWVISYNWTKSSLNIDYTGNLYSPMKLPLLSSLDPRKEYSPWWSIQNIQLTKKVKDFEIYTGIKNIFNWTPNKGNPFIIARSNDPFDKSVIFDKNGQAIPTPANPYGLTFDPTYVYGPNQGIRLFTGIRFLIK